MLAISRPLIPSARGTRDHAAGRAADPSPLGESSTASTFTADGKHVDYGPVDYEVLLVVEVFGRPATFATASEVPWKAAVRAAIAETGLGPWATSRFSVRLDFRLPEPRTVNESWDLDNLIKPTLDAMEGVFGLRDWRGRPQPADDRVDRIEASKRRARDGEPTGARIEVRSIAS